MQLVTQKVARVRDIGDFSVAGRWALHMKKKTIVQNTQKPPRPANEISPAGRKFAGRGAKKVRIIGGLSVHLTRYLVHG